MSVKCDKCGIPLSSPENRTCINCLPESSFAAPSGSTTWRFIGKGKKLHAFKGGEPTYALCGIGGRTSSPCDRPDEPRCKVCVGLLSPASDNNNVNDPSRSLQ